ncbi:hypothetical protein D9M71_710290 [compost metagenome]
MYLLNEALAATPFGAFLGDYHLHLVEIRRRDGLNQLDVGSNARVHDVGQPFLVQDLEQVHTHGVTDKPLNGRGGSLVNALDEARGQFLRLAVSQLPALPQRGDT